MSSVQTRGLLVLLALLVLGAGCVAPSGQDDLSAPDAPPDPETDVLGWEGGYWHNESLAVTHDDGLNETELDAVVTRAMARVEILREMEFDEPVPVEIESREAFRDRFDDEGEADESPQRILTDLTFEALFLVGEDRSGANAESSTTATTVIGFYSPGDDRIVLIAETATPQIRETVLAHELVHALQFRTFDMGYNGSTREAWHARNAVVEGDARLVDYRYRLRCGEDWTCLSPDGGGGGGGGQAHPGISVYQYFPYSDGPAFVQTIYQRGGWAAVNDLYANLPASTAQVIDPDKYGAPGPDPVRISDRSSDDWERLDPVQSLGMPGITSMFFYTAYDDFNETGVIDASTVLPPGSGTLDPVRYDIQYADGWRGDRLRGYRKGSARAYVWRLEWTDASEAREFATGYRAVLRHWGATRVDENRWQIEDGPFADAFRVSVEDDTVTIVNAPSLADLDIVHAG